VLDEGPGIDPRDADRVFDRFFQGDPSRSSGGTGLGLAIVRAIAEAQGGTARMSMPPGGGTAVVVTVPLALRTSLAPPDEPAENGVPGEPAHSTQVR
jgi:signal transduction histidine kinase